jgi:hypothetical protein
MLFEGIGDLSGAVDDEGKFVDDQKLEILSHRTITKAATLFPR